MASNTCPRCSEITLTIEDDAKIECPVCGTIYDVVSNEDHNLE